MALRVVLHEGCGHSPEGALLFALLSQLGTNASMRIGHDGFCLRTSVCEAEQIVVRLKSDAPIFAVDPRADEEGLTPSRSDSHSEARKQLVPVIDLPGRGGFQAPKH